MAAICRYYFGLDYGQRFGVSYIVIVAKKVISSQIEVAELKPLKDNDKDYEAIEKVLRSLFRSELYLPMVKELGEKRNVLKNDSRTKFLEAINSGRIQFNRGTFSGRFSAAISKELKALGARWERKTGTWKLSQSSLPLEVRMAISVSESTFRAKMERVDRKLAQILPEQIADKLKISKLFESTLWKTDNDFRKSLKQIIITPKLSPEAKKRIADEWQNNMKLWIKDWTQKEIVKLRKDMHDSVFAGNRNAYALKMIKKSYDVSINKAKFLARQETRLLLTKFKQTRYEDAGVQEYKWGISNNSIQGKNAPYIKGQVRHDHGVLAGKVFSWQNPPITDTITGSRNNPGQDYNCFPGSTIISLDRSIDKLFRRRYAGELTLLTGDDGIVLKSTGNHPILTRTGWKAAKEINVGEDILKGTAQNLFTEKMYGENVVTTFEQVFGALGFCSEVFIDRLSESDFHNDIGTDKEVNVISVNRELMLNNMARLYEVFYQLSFKFSDSSLFPKSSFPQNEIINGLAPDSLVGFFSELKFLILSHVTHADVIRFRTRSPNSFGLFDPSGYDTSADIKFLGTSKLTHPALITLNRIMINGEAIPSPIFSNSFSRVMDRSFEAFDGHVYNLQSSNGEYIAQNRVVHNCRCHAIPIVKFKKG